jgi:mono/diheme cytochrome c family protein
MNMGKHVLIWILVASLALITAACSGSSSQSGPAASEVDAASLYATNCAACHGADRSGKVGPALLPERLTKDRSVYVNTITNGLRGMPAWGGRLSADEINALVDYIMSAP